MTIILYETEKVEKLFPITLTRDAAEIFCGGATLFELIKNNFPKTNIIKLNRIYLRRGEVNISNLEDEFLFLNSALIPRIETVAKFKNLLKNKNSTIFKSENKIIGAYFNLQKKKISIQEISLLTTKNVEEFLQKFNVVETYFNWQVFENIWDLVTINKLILAENLQYLKKSYKKISNGFYTSKEVKLPKNLEVDTANGDILIGTGTKIFPFVFLEGPVFVGENCLVKEFSSLKDATCVGEVCKVGGEIEASIIHSYSNKQHYGFLGHSYIGSWINLGAGTTNSDLKNTYSKIKINGVDTGEQFLGCFIGDFSKTAINTSIYTGKIIGVSSNLYGTVSKNVASFTNYGSSQNMKEVPIEIALKVQNAMFTRRKKNQTSEDEILLKEIFSITKKERSREKVKAGKFSI